MNKPDNTILTFTVNLKTELPFWLISIPLIFVIGLITKPDFINIWPLVLGLTLILSAYSVLIYRLNIIEINPVKQEIKLTETSLLKRQKSRVYSLNDLQFTYKIGRTSMRSRRLNILTLYAKDKEVARVIPDHDGWTDDTVNAVVKGLTDLGVGKKFTGYSLKDAELNGL